MASREQPSLRSLLSRPVPISAALMESGRPAGSPSHGDGGVAGRRPAGPPSRGDGGVAGRTRLEAGELGECAVELVVDDLVLVLLGRQLLCTTGTKQC